MPTWLPRQVWPKGFAPFDRAPRGFLNRYPTCVYVRGRSGADYRVSSTPPVRGWTYNVVEVRAADFWLSYIHERRSGARLLIYYYAGDRVLPYEPPRAFRDFGLRSTLVPLSLAGAS